MKLYNDDCLNVLKILPDNSIDLVVTDPPYNIHAGAGGGIYANDDKKYIHELVGIDNGFDIKVLDELCRVMKKINIYIWCSTKQVPELLNYFINKKCNYTILTWHKTNPIPACNNKYLTDTEFCLFFREKGVKIRGSFDTKKTYYITPLNVKDKKLYNHPTIKPLNIIKNLIINSSIENDIVLDCFLGSGTTGVACKELNRDFIGIEIDKKYFEIARKRIDDTRVQTKWDDLD